jgi:hypothetical protein
VRGIGGATPARAFELLAAGAHLRVLAISTDGGETRLNELRSPQRLLGEVSKETLHAVIRGDVRNTECWEGM